MREVPLQVWTATFPPLSLRPETRTATMRPVPPPRSASTCVQTPNIDAMAKVADTPSTFDVFLRGESLYTTWIRASAAGLRHRKPCTPQGYLAHKKQPPPRNVQ